MYQPLSYISIFSPVLPILVSIIRRKNLDFLGKVLSLLAICSLIAEISSVYWVHAFKTQNTMVVNVYLCLEVLLLLVLGVNQLTNSVSKIIIAILGALILIFTILHLFMTELSQYNDLVNAAYCLLFIFIALLGFSEQLTALKYDKAWLNPYFWFNTALIIYFSGTLQLNLFFEYLLANSKQTLIYFWGIWHSCVNIVFYILITIAIYTCKIYKV